MPQQRVSDARMRVLFLDVDGVLNHRGVFVPGNGASPLCEKCVERLARLVERTSASVVLSSTWRLGGKHSEHVQKLKDAGVLNRAHDDWRTIDMPLNDDAIVVPYSQRRGAEIAEWLGRHPEVTRYAIVDDDSDMLPEQLPFFVQTTFDTGIQDDHVERIVSILDGE